jgi:hypothetical protein
VWVDLTKLKRGRRRGCRDGCGGEQQTSASCCSLQVDGQEARSSGRILKRPAGTIGDEENRPAVRTISEALGHGGGRCGAGQRAQAAGAIGELGVRKDEGVQGGVGFWTGTRKSTSRRWPACSARMRRPDAAQPKMRTSEASRKLQNSAGQHRVQVCSNRR